MRSKFTGILIALSILIVFEICVRLTNIYYLEQPEIFFVNLKRDYVESGKANADILMIGDSRSMALAGHHSKSANDYSVYNHSLPAMGAKYYRFFLDKYLKKGNKKPKMVLFAGSPLLYSRGYGPPLYDPGAKVVSTNEDVNTYLLRRWKEGWDKNLFHSAKKEEIVNYSGKQDNIDQILWEFFGHRYLHQFSVAELWNQYDGVERLFIIAKAVPLLYESYKFHGAIRNAMSLQNWKVSPDYQAKSAFCESCQNVETGLCLPSPSQREDNFIIEDQITRHLGKYNISNRVKPEIVQFARLKYKEEEKLEKHSSDPAKWEKIDFRVLEDLIAYTEAQDIQFGFVYMPWIASKEAAPEVQNRVAALKKFFASHPRQGIFFFPDSKYPIDLFVDAIHYDCRGEGRVNNEFENYVLPKVFDFLKKAEKSN